MRKKRKQRDQLSGPEWKLEGEAQRRFLERLTCAGLDCLAARAEYRKAEAEFKESERRLDEVWAKVRVAAREDREIIRMLVSKWRSEMKVDWLNDALRFCPENDEERLMLSMLLEALHGGDLKAQTTAQAEVGLSLAPGSVMSGGVGRTDTSPASPTVGRPAESRHGG